MLTHESSKNVVGQAHGTDPLPHCKRTSRKYASHSSSQTDAYIRYAAVELGEAMKFPLRLWCASLSKSRCPTRPSSECRIGVRCSYIICGLIFDNLAELSPMRWGRCGNEKLMPCAESKPNALHGRNIPKFEPSSQVPLGPVKTVR
jgi:hypothetical protein